MSKTTAKQELAKLSSGTLASLTGLRHMADIDAVLADMISAIDHADVSDCATWMDVWTRVQ